MENSKCFDKSHRPVDELYFGSLFANYCAFKHLLSKHAGEMRNVAVG